MDDYDSVFVKTFFVVITRLGLFLMGFCINILSLIMIHVTCSFDILLILTFASFVIVRRLLRLSKVVFF